MKVLHVVTFFLILSNVTVLTLSKIYIKMTTIPMSNIKNLKTGDIVLFSHEHFLSISQGIKLLTMSCWSHIGVILEENGDLYVLECTPRLNSPGTSKNPIKRLDEYKGSIAFMILNKPVPYQNIIINKKVIPFDSMSNVGIRVIERILNINHHSRNKGVHCSEYVSMILKEWGVISPDVSEPHTYPSDYSRLKIKTINGFHYKKQIYLYQ